MALITAGVLGFMQIELDAAQAVLAEAVELAAEIGEDALRGWAIFFQGLTAVASLRVELGRPRLEESRRSTATW